MPKKNKAAQLAKRVLRAAGAGDLAELQQIVGGSEGSSSLLECADADECQPLHRAAAAGHTCVVKYLLEQGVDPNCRKSKAKTPLHEAAAGGHGAIIELLLAQGALISAHKTNGWTPLMYSCMKGDAQSARLVRVQPEWGQHLIECTMGQANFVRLYNCRALATLTAHRCGAACSQLLRHGANLRDRNRDGQTALYLACREGHRALAELLLDPVLTADAPHTGHNAGRMPAAALQWQTAAAAEAEAVEAAEGSGIWVETDDSAAAGFAARGAEPLLAMRTRNMKTALHGAALNGHVDVVRFLLQPTRAEDGGQACIVPADPQATDLCGSTALIDAAANGQTAVVTELLEFGAATAKARRLDAELLLGSDEGPGLDPDPEPMSDGDVMQWVNQRDLNGRNALHCAVVGEATADVDEETRLAIVGQLLDYGLPVDSRDEDGSTPLYWSCAQGLDQVAALLLSRGADPNCRSARRSAIHVAIGWKHPQCLRLLLEHGADITARDLNDKDAVALVNSDDACEACRQAVLRDASKAGIVHQPADTH